MQESPKLENPWLVAVWPGMGHVAVSAGYYLMAKLGMHRLAEFSPRELFDIEYVEVKDGIIHPGRLPRSRFFVWKDPDGRRDIVVFIGEAQPPMGKHAFCHRLIRFASDLGVRKVVTFAAMATDMHPEGEARVFGASTDEAGLDALREVGAPVMADGRISGLNGALLGVAAEDGLEGFCLLGEMPEVFAQIQYPKAAHAVLQAFSRLSDIDLDLGELKAQADEVGEQLGKLLDNVEKVILQGQEDKASIPSENEMEYAEAGMDPEDKQRLETLFEQARKDRSKAYELKAELDRLHVFEDYEDRFLDLFR